MVRPRAIAIGPMIFARTVINGQCPRKCRQPNRSELDTINPHGIETLLDHWQADGKINPSVNVRLFGENTINHSNQLTISAHQCSTRSTGIDGGICLHEIFFFVESNIAASIGRDNTTSK